MKKNSGTILGLVLALLVVVGIATTADAYTPPSSPLTGERGTLSDVGATYRDNGEGGGKGTCNGGGAPRCFRPNCPSVNECPANDQCDGRLTCARYETVANGGKRECVTMGVCNSDPQGSIVIH